MYASRVRSGLVDVCSQISKALVVAFVGKGVWSSSLTGGNNRRLLCCRDYDLVFRKNLSVVCVLNIPLALAIESLSASTRSLEKGKVNGFTDLACP
jgi:hypothetical protein